MTTHVKIVDKPLIRDLNSKAVLNVDKNGLNEYLIKRDFLKKKTEEEHQMKKRLMTVEEDLKQIKNLLNELIQLRNINGN